jgi:hypothetical protein
MDLDEARIGGDFFQVGEDGIETLDVAGLEDGLFLLGQLHQLGCLGGVVGHGFFHQHVFAGGEEAAGQFEMGIRRRHNAEGLGAGQGVVQRGKNRDAEFAGDFCGLRSGDVVNAGERRSGRRQLGRRKGGRVPCPRNPPR